MKIIDLRSDTVTKPSLAMRKVMAEAEVGDDVFGDDPTVNRLERLAAEMLGTEDAVFATSGTQSNLIGVMSHCRRGDELIVGTNGHIYKYEAGGTAVLGSIWPQPLDNEPDGTLDLAKVATMVKVDDYHYARTRLLCLENTQYGRVLPLPYFGEAAACARKHNLKLHLDGARVFNACVKQKVDVKEISSHFDSISICLTKGLGAPAGSLLCGSRELVKEARRVRKMLGGGMRQSGILAAAGIYALENNIARLAEDHANADLLAEGLSEIDEVTVDHAMVQTNMVFISMKESTVPKLVDFLKKRDIWCLDELPMRLATHLDVNEEDLNKVIETFKEYFSQRS